MNKANTIFFIGKPGSGKGDQTKLLSERTGWKVIAAGKEFRALAEEDTPLGEKVKSVNDAGMLQPRWLAEYLFLENLFSLAGDEGVIFDGFGRRTSEAETIIDSLAWLGRPFAVVHLSVSDGEILRRLTLRKEVEGRADDSVVEERLKEYRENTEPVIELFRGRGTLVEVNGEGAREAIAADINAALSIA